MKFKQYQIVVVNLNPTFGKEMRKIRPCIILSPNEMNRYLRTLVIAPITSRMKPYPTRIKVKRNNVKGWVVLDQIKTIDNRRVIKVLDRLTLKQSYKIKTLLQEIYVW